MIGEEGVEPLLRHASELMAAGRVEEAIAAYEQLLARHPDLPDSWYNLAWLQRRARRFEAALASYGEALGRGVTGAEEVHVNRAVILADHLGRPDAAEAELKAALALDPNYVPALLNLGNLHEDRGERDSARAAYARALETEPGHALALVRLAGVSRPESPDAPIVSRLRQAIARAADPLGRADLGFALGQALDAAAAYDEAFAAYAAANAASRAASGARYDPKAHERLVDRLIRAFPRAAEPGSAPPSDAPLFICGMFRSGSTLTEQILAAHPTVTAGGELDLLPALIASELRPYPEAAAEASPDTLARVRKSYLDGVRAIHPGARFVTDKRPDNFLHIGLIKTLFPAAKIVHTVRDPLDNILSIYFLHLGPEMAYALDLADAAHWYGQYRRLMAHWHSLFPGDIYDADYDTLVADPRPAVEALLAFSGLPWDEACLSSHAASNVVKTASVWQVREPLYRRSSGRWRHYAAHLGPLAEFMPE
ncbi:MAG TPA: sulfotransferase [Allosphingosinicella sp.]|jgi:tetratricopeptide (TPR) repeat protein